VPLGFVLGAMWQVLKGLRHLHRLGILHRDLRTQNLLVASMDPLRVVLADLGLSHLLSAVRYLLAALSPLGVCGRVQEGCTMCAGGGEAVISMSHKCALR
jgi:serine/threonine protein kinase